jgi:hypothetical protein
MSRLMLISCGIQWLAQEARYFLPGPLVLERDKLVDVGLAVDDALVFEPDAAEALRHLHRRHHRWRNQLDRCRGGLRSNEVGCYVEAGIQTVL